eukprot:299113-Pelagomonas_calceolata.AAC.1
MHHRVQMRMRTRSWPSTATQRACPPWPTSSAALRMEALQVSGVIRPSCLCAKPACDGGPSGGAVGPHCLCAEPACAGGPSEGAVSLTR